MNLNELRPHPGAHKNSYQRRGYSKGKTTGRGHKGQKSRSGGSVNAYREGGQMPLYRRLPKFGFTSRVGQISVDLPIGVLNKLTKEQSKSVTMAVLQGANIVNHRIKRVKFYLSGEIKQAIHLKGLAVTCGAKAAIEKAKGTVETT